MENYSLCNIGGGERIAHFVLGIGLVTSIFAGSGPLGLAALLPLVGIYPMMTAILGVDPMHALVDGGRGGKSRGPAVYIWRRPVHA